MGRRLEGEECEQRREGISKVFLRALKPPAGLEMRLCREGDNTGSQLEWAGHKGIESRGPADAAGLRGSPDPLGLAPNDHDPALSQVILLPCFSFPLAFSLVSGTHISSPYPTSPHQGSTSWYPAQPPQSPKRPINICWMHFTPADSSHPPQESSGLRVPVQ